jgi:serine/threonine protein kinase
MDSQRWSKIESLYHAALAKDRGERSAYLDTACAEDPELRREVESLLGCADAELVSPVADGNRLPAGFSLGAYQILAPLGAGGMGEVYRARDTKLKRDVALKVLPDAYARDPERMARFQREAEVLASLNHPNIAHIYGVEERALVMELVEGESPKGPMPFEDAWKIAMQIADALEYAHERGVIHRDLKPANVKVTPEGVVKLLDFGLAKAFSQSPESAAANPENSPTLTLSATVAGTVLGTAAYMAPEQAKGKRVDKRADIWSWGVVLYELLTGERLFKGDEAADTLAQVLTKEPDLSKVPARIRKLVRRCLEKDPKNRLRDIGDARDLLDEPSAAAPSISRRGWLTAAALAPASAALGVIAWKHYREEAPHVAKLFFPPPEKGMFEPRIPTIAVSPDGRRVAFVPQIKGSETLWVRDLDNPEPRLLSSLESGFSGSPFWAPDSRRLGFFDGSKLKTIDVTGGPALTIADTGLDSPGSGSWNQDDVILFNTLGTPVISRIPMAGGTPAPVTEIDKSGTEIVHWAPWFLPDGRHFLYMTNTSDAGKSRVWVGDLASKQRKQVLGFATKAIYVNPGYLLYVRDRTLMAQPFDTGKLETTGEAVTLVEQTDTFAPIPTFVLGHFSASQNGVLMYTSGGGSGNVQLTWFDRSGTKRGTVGAPGFLLGFSLSPDGTTVAFTRQEPETALAHIWIHNLVHGSEEKLTFSGNNQFPVWSKPDGRYIFFYKNRQLCRKAANNTGPEEILEAGERLPMDASRDGHYLLTITNRNTPKTGNDIWVLQLSGDRKQFSYVATEFSEGAARLSPDGLWMAYQSNASKDFEIYVESFPNKGGKWQVSIGGGIAPVWNRDGSELYYYSRDGKVMAAVIKPGAQFDHETPKPLFPVNLSIVPNASFDVSKDGHFLLPALAEQSASAPMTVVLNWPELLKKK